MAFDLDAVIARGGGQKVGGRKVAFFAGGRHHRLADQDAAAELAGGSLQPARDVDGVAQHGELHAPGAADVADHHLAILDADR